MSNMSPCLQVLTLLTLAQALELAAWKAADAALEFQCQQHRRCAIRRQAATLTQGIEIERVETERGKQRVFMRDFVVGGDRGGSLRNCGAPLFQDVLPAF